LSFLKSISDQFAQFNAERVPACSNSADNIKKTVQSIDIKGDIAQYVSENKTGVVVPKDIEYIKYDAANPIQPSPEAGTKPAAPLPKAAKPAGKIGKYQGPSTKDPTAKEWGLSASDAILTQPEQEAKLHAQMADLEKLINSEMKSKDGLENLIRFYANDPTAQAKAQTELQDTAKKLEKLQEAKTLVQDQLRNPPTTKGGNVPSPHTHHAAAGGKKAKARALYNYDATVDTELTFKEGEFLTITEQDPSGWWYAMNDNGQEGFVPHNYVELVKK